MLAEAPLPALADDYPGRPIPLAVPFPVGASADNIGRLLSDKFAAMLRQAGVVEIEVASSAPDEMHHQVEDDFVQRQNLVRELDIKPLG